MSTIHNRLEEAAHEAIRALFVDNSVNLATTRLTLLELQTIIALRLDAMERMQEVRCLLSEEQAAESDLIRWLRDRLEIDPSQAVKPAIERALRERDTLAHDNRQQQAEIERYKRSLDLASDGFIHRNAEIGRLRKEVEEANRILDFVKASMQMYSPGRDRAEKMNGQYSWRFMSHMMRETAPTAGEALRLNADRYHNDVAKRQEETL